MGCTGIAQDPTTGTIYLAVRNSPSTGINDISLATVDRVSGVVTKIGHFTTTGMEAASGIQFNSAGQLYAVSGEVGSGSPNPTSLFTVNKATGASVLVKALATGDMGETIGFDPTNTAVMYHWSGSTTQVYETVNLTTGAQTPVPTTGVPASVTILCMGWDSEAQWFWTCTNVNQFGYIRPNGAYVQGFGAMAGQAKGILVLPTSIPSVSTLPLGTTTQGTASTPVSFNLNGSNLFGDITIAAPSGVEVSLSAGSGYTNSLAVPRSSTSGELNQTQIFARITSGAPQGAITGVNLTLTALGADAVDISLTGQVDPAPTPPEMDVLNGVTSIADGGMDPQGIVTVSASQMITYTIQNSGSQDLNLTGTPLVSLANANNVQNLSVSIAPSTPIAGMSSDAFEVSYEAIVNGVFSFTISIDNNDSNENPYNWTVSGTAQALPPPEMDVLNGASAIASGGTDAQGPQLPLMTPWSIG
jgi:hypothetical protein